MDLDSLVLLAVLEGKVCIQRGGNDLAGKRANMVRILYRLSCVPPRRMSEGSGLILMTVTFLY